MSARAPVLPGFPSRLAPMLGHNGTFAGLLPLADFGVPARGETVLMAGRLSIVALVPVAIDAAVLAVAAVAGRRGLRRRSDKKVEF